MMVGLWNAQCVHAEGGRSEALNKLAGVHLSEGQMARILAHAHEHNDSNEHASL
jgi:hypothetical protein